MLLACIIKGYESYILIKLDITIAFCFNIGTPFTYIRFSHFYPKQDNIKLLIII